MLAFLRRNLDILASVHIRNEHRGIDQAVEAVRGRYPDAAGAQEPARAA